VLELRLEHVEDLFAVPGDAMLREHARLYPGIDELVQALDARPVRVPHVVIRFPAEALRDDTGARIGNAVRAYCDQRLEHTRHQIAAQRRDGLRALILGVVLFSVGFLVARWVSQSDLDADVRLFLADGIFLIFAWVGLWYPLDALIYYPARQRRDRRVLRRLRAAEITVTSW
jgi:hypothetical protein